jgi:membrane-associated protein
LQFSSLAGRSGWMGQSLPGLRAIRQRRNEGDTIAANPLLQAMDIAHFLFDFVLHVDRHLSDFVMAYGAWVYALLFAIIFIETGLVVMPFLPGDSLLFVVGALCGLGLMSLPLTMLLLTAAAILGNQTNYAIGRRVGPKVFAWPKSRWFNRDAFDRMHAFYERYGGITIVLARFMPFLRTFAPFVAGVAQMTRSKFTLYDVSGGVLWVCGLTLAGYFFGNIPWVQKNLSTIIWAMILVPGLLVLIGAWRARQKPVNPA